MPFTTRSPSSRPFISAAACPTKLIRPVVAFGSGCGKDIIAWDLAAEAIKDRLAQRAQWVPFVRALGIDAG